MEDTSKLTPIGNFIKTINQPGYTVYILDIRDVRQVSEEECRRLFPERMKKAGTFRFEEDRLRCISAGLLIYEALGAEERDIRYNAYGKPYIEGKSEFSLSHSGDYAVLAASKGLIGADIEEMKPAAFEIIPRAFTPEEAGYIGNDPGRFYSLWTMKEALSKAIGRGLELPFQEISVLPLVMGENLDYEGTSWQGSGHTLYSGNYVLSVVSESTGEL